MSHETAVEHSRDDMIQRVRETTLAVYYMIGTKITVSDRTSGSWFCHHCTGNNRYEQGDHKGCVHIQRVKLWAADHPQEAAA